MSDLAKKLQVKPGKKWLFFNPPENFLSSIDPLPDGVTAIFEMDGDFDGVLVFVKNSQELNENLAVLSPFLKADTITWVAYPKKASGIKTDLEMGKSWEQTLQYGLRTVSAASINEHWTALRMRPETQTKASEFCNEEIEKNDHSQYIDLENRKIIPPPDMQAVLSKSPSAMTFFESLSFTNKKEYVVWILSAKQEKTKADRLGKLVEKLEIGRKNPSDKG